MSFNITVEGGTSVRLPTAGKYCDRDIVVTAQGGGGDDVKLAGSIVDKTVTEFINPYATSIGEYSLRSCTKLLTVDAPNAKSIGQYAMTTCSLLNSVNFPLVESVGQYAFNQCNKLKYIALPSLASVSSNALRDCQYVETIDIGPALASIPANTFYGCRGLLALILRSETMVTLAATSAFTTCYRLLGTKNSGFNPNGERLGYVYVPAALVAAYQADATWTGSLLTTQFRAIEDYPEICGGT